MFLVCFLCTMSVCAQKVTYTGYDVSRLNSSKGYYLYNRGSGQYLTINGSKFIFVSDTAYASKFTVTKSGNEYILKLNNSNKYIGGYVEASGFLNTTWEYELDASEQTAWQISKADSPYNFYNLHFTSSQVVRASFFSRTVSADFYLGVSNSSPVLQKGDVSSSDYASQWQFLDVSYMKEQQEKAINIANYMEGSGAAYKTAWNSDVAVYNSGSWMAQNTEANNEWCVTVSGLPDGKYTVKADVVQTGSGAVMHIGSGDKVSAQDTVLNNYNVNGGYTGIDLSVTVTDGAFKLWVEKMQSAGYVRLKINNMIYDASASGSAIASAGFWTPEAPTSGNYFILECNDNRNKYFALPGEIAFNIKSAALLTFQNGESTPIYYTEDGVSKYMDFRNGEMQWTSGTRNVTIEKAWGDNYRLKSGSYYMMVQSGELAFTQSANGVWQFVSDEQYNSVYPVDLLKTQLGNSNVNVGRFFVSGTKLENDVWVTRYNSAAGVHNLEYVIGGLNNGTYQIVMYAKKSGDGVAKIVANDGESEELTNDLALYTVEAIVSDGSLNIYIDTEDDNAGEVYAAIQSIEVADTFRPTALTSKSWKQIKKLNDNALENPGDYFFTIWSDESTALTLKKGTTLGQGTGYNTMSYTSLTDDVLGNLANLWEIYPTAAGKFVFVSASQREYMLQTESGLLNKSNFRFNASTEGNIEYASVAFSVDKNSNWNFETKNGYLTHALVNNVKDIRVSSDKANYKLFAISRVDYYKEVANIIYNASTFNAVSVPLLVANPDALGTNGGKEVLGWNVQGKGLVSDSVSVKEGNASNFAPISNRAYFEYDSKTKPTGTLQQTIHNLPEGLYQFSGFFL